MIISPKSWKDLDFVALDQSSMSFSIDEKPESAMPQWPKARTRAAKVGKLQTLGSGISIPLAVGTPSTGSGKLYCQWMTNFKIENKTGNTTSGVATQGNCTLYVLDEVVIQKLLIHHAGHFRIGYNYNESN
nr:hypothetical protein [Tanacetum cinerariifolium]